jgi:hemin uptake protein HemP
MMQAATPTSTPRPGPAETGAQQCVATPTEPVQSAELFKGQKSVVIEHNGARYRLQATKLGKLILTK